MSLSLTPASLLDATRMIIAGGCPPGQLARLAAEQHGADDADLTIREIIEAMVEAFTTVPPRVPEVYTAQMIRYASEHPAAVVALASAHVLNTMLAPPSIAEFLRICDARTHE